MRETIYAVLCPLVGIESIWKVCDILLRIPRAFDTARAKVLQARGPIASAQAALDQLCPESRVMQGLCEGMQFPRDQSRRFQSSFSTIGAMLLGLYERPLEVRLAQLCHDRDYDLIVDVGSADGYYAVGLARRCPSARVIAFDTDPAAQRATALMAQKNGVSDRVTVEGFCDTRDLQEIVHAARRALILSDCEGYEYELFSAGCGETLRAHDVIIELHDQVDYRISIALRDIFCATHVVEMLRADDDLQIVRTAHEHVPALAAYDWQTRDALVSEHRRYPGEWLIALSR